MDKFQTLLSLPKSSVVALYNRKKNKAFLTLCKDTNKRLSRIADELRNEVFRIDEMIHDQNDLELIILETLDSVSCQDGYNIFRLHMNYWYDYVSNLGIKLYGRRHTYLEYKPRISLGVNENGNSVIFVELVSKRNDSFIVGVFSNYDEAESFKKRYFDEQKYVYPVYATNELTKNFIEFQNVIEGPRIRF